jgi:glycosyltransferase involved in cell wall biosynthesis
MHGLNGLLVPVRNAPALADALETLLSNAELRHTMGRAGRETAINQFSLARVNTETLAVYEIFLAP